jgi:transcriptional regulator GlxA family with amidase domain
MVFVKQVRLRHAQERLLRPTRGTSVTSVALECGFHFAKDYFASFGERPSNTLKRGKQSRGE